MTDLDTRRPEFTIAIRGYDRLQVDEYIERLQKLLGEAEERARIAEGGQDLAAYTSVGPRISQILDLAAAEARDLREKVERQTRELLSDARSEARKIVESAEATARERSDQATRDWETMLAEYEQERDQIRAQVAELDERRRDVLGDLRRLYDALGAASGMVGPANDQLAGPDSQVTTLELPRPAEEGEDEDEDVEPPTTKLVQRAS